MDDLTTIQRPTLSVATGVCHTCGWTAWGELHGLDYLTRNGRRLATIAVDGHCGKPGHNTYTRTVARREYDTAPASHII